MKKITPFLQRNIQQLFSLVIMFLMSSSFFSTASMAQTATVSTSKLDYQPGQTLIITGTNWKPGETVTLKLTESPLLHAPEYLYAVADANGNIYNAQYVFQDSDFGQAFLLDATGQTSGFTASTNFTDGAGSYSIKWYAADPALNEGPFLPTYPKVAPAVQACSTPSGGIGRASGPLANSVAYASPAISSNRDAVTSLAPKDMALCQIVPFFLEITVDGSTAPENGVITINPEWLAKTTSGGNFGFDPAYGVYCAFVDDADPGTTDPGADAKVDSYSAITLDPGGSNERIYGTIQVSGLDDGDRIIVELWVVLKCTIPPGSTGNVQTSLADAHTGPSNTTGESINTGNQTVPLLRVQEFFSAEADISVTKSSSPVCIGKNITYNIVVTNNSTSIIANGVVATDVLGANQTFVSASGAPFTQSGQTVTFNIGSLTQLQSVNLTVVATPTVTGSVSNSVTVTAITDDPNTANNTASTTTTVNALPICSITGGVETINPGSFTNWCATAGMISYSWTGPTGFVASTDQCVDVSIEGEYTVIITNANGCTSTCKRTLTVGCTPSTEPEKVNCWDNFVFNTTTCEWDNTGRKPAEPEKVNCWDNFVFNSRTCVWDNTGTKPVKPTLGCYQTATFNTTTCVWDVVTGIPPTVYAGADFTITCILNPIGRQIGETPVAGFTYSWLPIAGLSNAAIANPIANPSASTTYTVTKTNTTTGCKVTDIVCVTVNKARPANPYVTQTPPTCTVSTGTVTVTSPIGAGFQYSNNGGAYQSSPVFTIAANAAYSITVKTVSTGCTSMSPRTGKMAAQPVTPAASIGCSSQRCTGTVATFSLTAVTTNAVSILWTKSAGADGSFSTTSGSPTIYTPGPNDKIKGVTITLAATSSDGCCKRVTIKLNPVPCGLPYYTYTQGYYSGSGSACTPLNGSVKGSGALVQISLDNIDGVLGNSLGQLYLGRSGASFSATYADAAKLVAILPGGGTATRLYASHNLSVSASYPPLKNGKISNILLSQTIALSLNKFIPGNGLKYFVLKTGYLTTITRVNSSCTSGPASCATGGKLSSLKVTSNTTLMNLLNNQTVDSLLRMASKALGGTLPAGVGYSDISGAVDVINKSFDEGRYFIGYYSTAQSCGTPTLIVKPINGEYSKADSEIQVKELTVTAYPNPFIDRVKFNIVSPVSGNASLDVYNMLGQKVANVYRGYLQAGRGQVIEYNATGVKETLIYSLRVGDKQVNGKVIHLK